MLRPSPSLSKIQPRPLSRRQPRPLPELSILHSNPNHPSPTSNPHRSCSRRVYRATKTSPRLVSCTAAVFTAAMQLTTLFLAALSAVSVTASPSWMGGDQVTIKEEYKVPGDNPLYFCGDPADDLLKIEKVDLSPNPPKPYVFLVEVSCSCAIAHMKASRISRV